MKLELPALPPAALWSVQLLDLDSGATLAASDPGRVLRTASIGKLFLLLRAAHLLASGQQDPDAELRPSPDDLVADSGLLYLLRQPGVRFADACVLVGAVSDNLATNLLVESVGLDTVQRTAQALGCVDSTLLDKVRDVRVPGLPETLSLGRADELSGLVRRLATGDGLPSAECDLVNGWLGADADTSMVAGGLGLDPLAHLDADHGVVLRHKTGTISNARCDVGWVRNEESGRGVAYAVLANWAEGDPLSVRLQVLAAMRALGARLRERVSGG